MIHKRKIGLFGGTFNPIHIGHLRVAEEVRQKLGLEEIIFIPSFRPPFRKKNLLSFKHRIKMVQLAISTNPFFSVSNIESTLKNRSYTIYTIQALKKRHQDTEMFFIIGTDSFLEFPKWYKPEQLLNMMDLIIIFRHPVKVSDIVGSPLLYGIDKAKLKLVGSRKKMMFRPLHGGGRLIFLQTTLLDISATMIRSMIRKGESVKYVLPQRVESYIISNKLYE